MNLSDYEALEILIRRDDKIIDTITLNTKRATVAELIADCAVHWVAAKRSPDLYSLLENAERNLVRIAQLWG